MLLAVRVLAVWLLIITAEVVHGIVRALVLTPVVGDFRARQIGVLTGSLLIVLTSALTIRWIRASRPRTLLIIGSAWVVLTVAFEISLGRMMGYSWERLGSDYNTLEGGLLPIGFVIMATSPLIAARLRGCRTSGVSAAALQGQSWGPSRSTGGAQNRQAEAPTRRQPGTGGRAGS